VSAESLSARHVTLPDGQLMPIVGIGTWEMRGRKAYESVRYALDVGYRHIDTATMYGNEAEVGRALRDSGVPRVDVFVTTKLPPGNAGRERATIEESLRALGLDYVNLWLIHWPPRGGAAPDTWRALLDVRDAGQAHAVGVSNYSTAQVDQLIEATGQAPAVNQIPWSPRLFDARRLEHSRSRGVVLEGYSPLKGSNLADPVLRTVADAHGVSPAQVVLRWHVEHQVVVIPKSVRPDRIRANLDISGFTLSADEVARIDALGEGRVRRR
jgi:diketogulonate reductase-like aldo/keto reductase